jgi:Tfp pilus assembly protein PilV
MKKNAGMTLIEVLFVVGLISTVMVAMTALLTRSLANTQFSKNRALAGVYVQEGLELARSARDQSSDWSTFSQVNDPESERPPFTRAIFIIPDPESADKKRVDVTVNWTDAKGPHEVKASSYLTRW